MYVDLLHFDVYIYEYTMKPIMDIHNVTNIECIIDACGPVKATNRLGNVAMTSWQ